MESTKENEDTPVVYFYESKITSEEFLVKWKLTNIETAFKAGSSPCERLISELGMEFTTSGKILGHPTWKLTLTFEAFTKNIVLTARPVKYHGVNGPMAAYNAVMEIMTAGNITVHEKKSATVYVTQRVENTEQGVTPAVTTETPDIFRPPVFGTDNSSVVRNSLGHASVLTLCIAKCNEDFYSKLEEAHGSIELLIKFTQIGGQNMGTVSDCLFSTKTMSKNHNASNLERSDYQNDHSQNTSKVKVLEIVQADMLVKRKEDAAKNQQESDYKKPRLE